MSELTILLVDDHPVVREGYRRLLERTPGYRVVAEASDAAYLMVRDFGGSISAEHSIGSHKLESFHGLESPVHLRAVSHCPAPVLVQDHASHPLRRAKWARRWSLASCWRSSRC